MSKILVVDDDAALRNRLSELLTEEGYEVASAGNGEEAIEKMKKEDFEVVFTDLVMPGMSGIDMLREIKKIKPEVQVIMITAYATIESAIEAMKKGASDYLCKPFKINEVQTIVRRVLEEARLEREQKAVQELSTISLGSSMSKSFSNPIRREAAKLLHKHGKVRFTEIKKKLGIDDPTKLSFHLRILKSQGIVEQDSEKVYCLTEVGRKAFEAFKHLEKGTS